MVTGTFPLSPGRVIGILGGGQLGRMLAFAAQRLGYRVHGFAPIANCPLSQVTGRFTCADYGDEGALSAFADEVDIVTFEFENVPASAVRFLAERVPVRPGEEPLATIQDRLMEKRFLANAGVPVAPFSAVSSKEDLARAVIEVGLPAVLKTRRFGYDGKGQALIETGAELETAWSDIGGVDAILEAFIPFDREVSIVAAHTADGAVAAFPLTENRHAEHILATSVAPADVSDSVARQASEIAHTILAALDYVGVMGIELFLTRDDTLLVNELAPRVHNSAHWTIEGAATSQFEQHIRAICGLPLGPAHALFKAEMTNLIGDAAARWADYLAEPGAILHLYGKSEMHPGRKMGHVTRLSPLRG